MRAWIHNIVQSYGKKTVLPVPPSLVPRLITPITHISRVAGIANYPAENWPIAWNGRIYLRYALPDQNFNLA